MLRVVVDANVWVSAAISRGASHRIVHLWLERSPFEVVICPRLLEEVREVLERPRLRRFISEDAARLYLDTIGAAVDLVPDPVDVALATRDGDDDYLVALAQTERADSIVTGDGDLLEWSEQMPPAITPAQFEALLAESSL